MYWNGIGVYRLRERVIRLYRPTDLLRQLRNDLFVRMNEQRKLNYLEMHTAWLNQKSEDSNVQ
ncbi:MAG: hypothetical protein BMS9Abin28_1382 [Anaerolineae bacterium]|nr:MAG: hypothetical protein BMS9Abin28_1382 [Anaerolineae bacterium]